VVGRDVASEHSKRWEVQGGKFVYVELDEQVADADTLGEIVDELQAALAWALEMLEVNDFGRGGDVGRAELAKAADLRAKFLGDKP
jgi:hypothetical protein